MCVCVCSCVCVEAYNDYYLIKLKKLPSEIKYRYRLHLLSPLIEEKTLKEFEVKGKKKLCASANLRSHHCKIDGMPLHNG